MADPDSCPFTFPRRPDGSLLCVACMLCVGACPAAAVAVVAEPRDFGESTAPRRCRSVAVDLLRCLRCGECGRVCPNAAIILDPAAVAPPVLRAGDAILGACQET